MSIYWNGRTRGLRPYVAGEQPRDRKFIKLNTNENPYPPSPLVIEAIRRAASGDLRLYPDPDCTELRAAAAECYGVRPDQVFAGNGSDEVLAFAFAAFFESAAAGGAKGGKPLPVLFPDITYSFYPVYAELWQVPFQTVPLGEDFSVKAEDYLVPAGGVVLANPNAPTALALDLGDLAAIARYQGERNRILLADEAYAPFNGGASAVSLLPACPNILTIHTLSKAASLAGLRVGFAIAGEELIEGLCRIRDSFNSYPLDRLAQAGAAAALADRDYYDGVNRKVSATRDRFSAALREMGFQVLPSRTNFVFVRPPCLGGAAFFAALREKGILVRRFDRPRIGDFLRISIGTDAEMDTVLERCGEILREASIKS